MPAGRPGASTNKRFSDNVRWAAACRQTPRYYTLKAQPILGSPKHRTPRFDQGVLADSFLSSCGKHSSLCFSTQVRPSVNVGTVSFTSKNGADRLLANFVYLLEGICTKPYEFLVSGSIISSLRTP